jgi:hypothetical protein
MSNFGSTKNRPFHISLSFRQANKKKVFVFVVFLARTCVTRSISNHQISKKIPKEEKNLLISILCPNSSFLSQVYERRKKTRLYFLLHALYIDSKTSSKFKQKKLQTLPKTNQQKFLRLVFNLFLSAAGRTKGKHDKKEDFIQQNVHFSLHVASFTVDIMKFLERFVSRLQRRMAYI